MKKSRTFAETKCTCTAIWINNSETTRDGLVFWVIYWYKSYWQTNYLLHGLTDDTTARKSSSNNFLLFAAHVHHFPWKWHVITSNIFRKKYYSPTATNAEVFSWTLQCSFEHRTTQINSSAPTSVPNRSVLISPEDYGFACMSPTTLIWAPSCPDGSSELMWAQHCLDGQGY